MVDSAAVKVRFNVTMTLAKSASAFAVTVGSTPTDINVCKFTVQTTIGTHMGYLTFSEIAHAAAVRQFGTVPTASSLNYTATEYAIQCVRMYGPPFPSTIRLGYDAGFGLPGVYASDIGTTASRPAIAARAPRLTWRRADGTDESTVSIWFSDLSPPQSAGAYDSSGPQNQLSYQIGVVDVTVLLRRAAFANAFALNVVKTSS